jgi:hypothetical protein
MNHGNHRKHAQRPSGWKLRLAALLLTLLLCLALLEGLVRFAGLAPDYRFYPGPFESASTCDYRLRPGYQGTQGDLPVDLDAHGFRVGRATATTTAALGHDQTQDRRILLLGDSVLFGWGVTHHESFAGLLEQRLAEEPAGGGTDTVHNAGTPGYGAWHYRHYLERVFDEIRPTEVVLLLFTNDWEGRLWDVTPEGSLTPVGLKEVRSGLAERLFNHAWCSRHSAFYRLLKNAMRNLLYQNQGFGAMLDELLMPSALANLEHAGKWATCFEELAAIRAFLEARSVPLVIYDITGLPGVHRLLNEEGYRVIRLESTFSADAGELLPQDAHPNAVGHRRLFEVFWDRWQAHRSPDSIPPLEGDE